VSFVTDVLITAITDESAAIAALNAWLREKPGIEQQLNEVSAEDAGGYKVPNLRLYAAAINYLDTEGLEDAIRKAPWRQPTSVIAYFERERQGAVVMSPARPDRWIPGERPDGKDY
jgi:hypothetical protein